MKGLTELTQSDINKSLYNLAREFPDNKLWCEFNGNNYKVEIINCAREVEPYSPAVNCKYKVTVDYAKVGAYVKMHECVHKHNVKLTDILERFN